MSRYSVLQKFICVILVVTLVPGSIYANTFSCKCLHAEDTCCCETTPENGVKKKKSCCASKAVEPNAMQRKTKTAKTAFANAINKNKNAHIVFLNCNCLSSTPTAPLVLSLSPLVPEIMKELLSFSVLTLSTDPENTKVLLSQSGRYLLDQNLHQCTAENVQSLQCIWLI